MNKFEWKCDQLFQELLNCETIICGKSSLVNINHTYCNTPMTLLLFSYFENYFYYVMSYETQNTQMTFAQPIFLFNYYIKENGTWIIQLQEGTPPWHKGTCVIKLQRSVPIKSNLKLNNQTRS